jgi:phage terminase small subunit
VSRKSAKTLALQQIQSPSLTTLRPPKLLDNPRQERFAQMLAKGMKQGAAYREAGYKYSAKSATKLAASPSVKARVQEILQAALADTTLTIQRVTAELEKIAFANMLDYVKIDDEGQPTLDFTELERDKAAAIGEITTDVITNPRDGNVTRRTKFRLLDKKGSLVDLGRHLGMFKADNTKDLNVKGVIFHVTPDDMAL